MKLYKVVYTMFNTIFFVVMKLNIKKTFLIIIQDYAIIMTDCLLVIIYKRKRVQIVKKKVYLLCLSCGFFITCIFFFYVYNNLFYVICIANFLPVAGGIMLFFLHLLYLEYNI